MSQLPLESRGPAADLLPTGWRVPLSLLMLAGPIIASMCSRTVMSFIDFVMVSRLGTQAQAAISPAAVLLFCFLAFGMGLLSAVSTFVSQALGREDRPVCGAFAWQGVYLSLLLGLACLPLWPLVPQLFAWVGHEPAVQAMETAYVQIGLLGVVPALMVAAVSNFFNGIHRPAVGLWSTLLANLVNIAANWVLIYGNLGFPALGVAGAAWGTLLASVVQTAVLLGWMLRPSLARAFATRSAWRLDLQRLGQVFRLGLPAGAQFAADIVAFTVFVLLLVGRFGTVQLAANNIVFRLLEVSFMPTIGLGVALTAAVGKAIGAGRRDYARLVTRWAAGFAIGYMGLIGACYILLREQLVGLLSDDPEVMQWAGRLLMVCALFQIFDAMGITHMSALRGAGDNHWPAVVSVSLSVVLFLGGGYVIAERLPHLGAVGPWLAATFYIMSVGVTMWSRWRFGPWERIDLFQSPPPAVAAA